eukprot:CAMPEP_0181307172 /NCGR_PEP_ID=MMETSP1101-20121128/10724_1 /TAXON_ID=46948 /ORGANISM="Rhodomonas abbreviata, Strain Caron Lab Isolate" /LENGTH=340 /DNA_ID=CAMNT_0023413343 /DNA_START=73 /DNA_END=1095 /DNA_ORIENTATION=+
MLRIKDPKLSVPFYVDNFGFTLIHKYDFPQWKFSLYFLATLSEEERSALPEVGTPASEQLLWSMKGVCLELTHNHGTEDDPDFKVSSGNVEPLRGFGHLAVMTPDVYAASAELEQQRGVKFQKRPDEGKMKGLAFALDPDGYWVEIIRRSAESCTASNGGSAGGSGTVSNKFTYAQTMLRIKDPAKSLHFYRDLLGMTLLRQVDLGVGTDWGFSLFFLAHLSDEELASNPPPADIRSPEASEYINCMFGPVLELTHNHGTEDQPDFKYYNGNDEGPGQVRGFGHTGFLCDDLEAACASLESSGVAFKKKPQEGNMRGLAFAYDPDNYWVEIIQRKGIAML